jgi:hypothetical protein
MPVFEQELHLEVELLLVRWAEGGKRQVEMVGVVKVEQEVQLKEGVLALRQVEKAAELVKVMEQD